jgi:hypothetical protein
MALGGDVFANLEMGLVGVQPGNANQRVDNFSYSLVISMLIIDTILYSLLAWYFTEVTGRGRRSWYFLCYPPLWCRRIAKPPNESNAGSQENVEAVPHALKQQIAEQR